MSTVSLETCKEYLRIDHDLDETSLQLLLDAAENHVRALCIPFKNAETGALTALPEQLQAATLLLTAHWYDNRGVMNEGRRGSGVELPYSVSSLLASFRG